MTAEELNTQLYKKLFAEQEKYREWLLAQPPSEILNHCYVFGKLKVQKKGPKSA